MSNGKLSFDEFKKEPQEVRDWYVYDKLTTLSNTVNGLENKYATKWVETAAVWIIRIVIGAVIAAGLGYILVSKAPILT